MRKVGSPSQRDRKKIENQKEARDEVYTIKKQSNWMRNSPLATTETSWISCKVRAELKSKKRRIGRKGKIPKRK